MADNPLTAINKGSVIGQTVHWKGLAEGLKSKLKGQSKCHAGDGFSTTWKPNRCFLILIL